ncbi:MAG: hypothetical protein LBR51_01340 [Bacteroidales bacterium]|jgi:tetratricopeptide (TPR) repeat protein|nr:hypothetical protein [Bacteroidales bacterium]
MNYNENIQFSEKTGDKLREYLQQYPASSVLVYYYIQWLQDYDPATLEKEKPRLLLSLLNRKAYREAGGNPDFSTVSEDELTSAETTTPKEAKNEEIIDHLIDTFSKNPPKIQFDPERHDAHANYEKESSEEDIDVISETLAIIYAKQGSINKAIKIYKKLGLIFPEKSCYFANRILELKNNKIEKEKTR